jgi:hypothetical protein
MNFRAIMLLAAALLMQLGQGLALGGASDRAEGHPVACAYGCCAALEVCPCAEAPASDPKPQTPMPLPVSGREQAPQPVMTVATAPDFIALSARNADDACFHPVAPRMIAVSAVPLTVLHCAFLI